MTDATYEFNGQTIHVEFKMSKHDFQSAAFQQTVYLFPQYQAHALYARAYGMSANTFRRWVDEQERRVPDVVKRFRVTAKQWENWTWHERVAGVNAGFNPGRTFMEAFEEVKKWLAFHNDPIDTDVPKDALEHFDEKAWVRTKERVAKARVERAELEREKKQRDRDEKHRLRIRIQHLLDKNERESEIYERRIRDLKSALEEARHPSQVKSANVCYRCPECGEVANQRKNNPHKAPLFCASSRCDWEGDAS
jgi:hypothetical protein